MSALESKIDDLYRGALDVFTAERNALAKTLSGADAARVRKLAKPSVVPWAVNQLYWHARASYDRLLKSGEQLRKTQIDALEGRRADVRAAAEKHRAAIGDAAKEALRVASGSHPSADALMRTLEALSLMPNPPDPPGRLLEPLQPAGFEALAGVPLRALPRPSSHESPSSRESSVRVRPDRNLRLQPEPEVPVRDKTTPHRPDRRAQVEARKREAAAKAHAAAMKKAEAAYARAQAAATHAREAADRASRAVTEAAADLDRLRASAPPD